MQSPWPSSPRDREGPRSSPASRSIAWWSLPFTAGASASTEHRDSGHFCGSRSPRCSAGQEVILPAFSELLDPRSSDCG